MRTSSVIAVVAALALPAFVQAFEIDKDKFEKILSDSKLFETKSDDMEFKTPGEVPLFKWLSKTQSDEAHFPAFSNSGKLKLFGEDVKEASLRFKDGTLSDVYISIYNRGDSGSLELKTFNDLVAKLDAKISDWAGDKGVLLKKAKLNSDVNIQAKVWVKEPFAVNLKWSATGKSVNSQSLIPEYIQLTIEKFDPKDDPRKQTSVGDLRGGMTPLKELVKNVEHGDDSEVSIAKIPMVDQGAKGYCVDASAARVLRYYGVDVTQHDIAQISNTDAKAGTMIKEMIDAIKKISTKYGVKVREYYKEDSIRTVQEFEKYIKKYNSVATKSGKKAVKMVVRGNTVYPDDTLELMDPDIIKKMRVEGDKTEMKAFLRDVKACVDKGVPVLWAVKLGIVKEPGLPQISGNHMRLIIGYNDKESQILYSDSWGPGHELKKMSYDDAWLISSFAMSLDPLK